MSNQDAWREEVFNRPWMHTAPGRFGMVLRPFGGVRAYLAEIERAYYAGPWR